MSYRGRIPLGIVGGVALATAGLGLLVSGVPLTMIIGHGVPEMPGQPEVPYFLPAFYIMTGICVACYLALAVMGLDFLRGRMRCFWAFTGLMTFEVAFFFVVSALWLSPKFGLSVAAASGIAIGGLMPQFLILFPLWGPLTLIWVRAKTRAILNTPMPANLVA